MTKQKQELDAIIEREGLAADIASSVEFFREKLPLSIERKAQFAKAAIQNKCRLSESAKAFKVCDEIDAVCPPSHVLQHDIKEKKKRIIGSEISGWVIKDVLGALVREARLLLRCPKCGAEKELHIIAISRKDPKTARCVCNGGKILKPTKQGKSKYR